MSGHEENHGVSSGKYIAGFVLAVILTLLSFIPVMYNMLDGWTVSGKIIYLMGMGIIQIVMQIVYFLHLNHGPDAKWNIGTMWFGSVCVFIIIGGTWWAIQHLNYNMMGGSGRIIIPPVIGASENANSESDASSNGNAASTHEATPENAADPVSNTTSQSGASSEDKSSEIPAIEVAPSSGNSTILVPEVDHTENLKDDANKIKVESAN